MVQMEEDQANICLLKESLDKSSQKVRQRIVVVVVVRLT